MRMLYIIGKLITLPGSFIRAFWEHLTCKILKLPVEEGGYIGFHDNCGHIDHAFASKGFAAYLMATGPGYMNMIIGWPLMLMGYINLKPLGITPYDSIPLFIIYILSYYIGVSLLCCQFPLVEDILVFWEMAYKEKKVPVIGRIFAFIPALVTKIGAYLERWSIPVIFWIIATVLLFIL